jgi:hypothetical protein
MTESQDVADYTQKSSLVSDFDVAPRIPTYFASNLSCHSYHLILLLKMSKPVEPLKGDAHDDNTFCSHKLSVPFLGCLSAACFCTFTEALQLGELPPKSNGREVGM